jgi:EF hand
MLKKSVAIVSVLLLTATAAVADSWSEKFKILDTDGKGRVAQSQYDANSPKLGIRYLPTFAAIDTNNDNSIDAEEWAAAEKFAKSYASNCKSSTSSWCEKQNCDIKGNC